MHITIEDIENKELKLDHEQRQELNKLCKFFLANCLLDNYSNRLIYEDAFKKGFLTALLISESKGELE